MCGWVSSDQTNQFVKHSTRRNAMKKLMTLMLGLCLAMGTVVVSFADDAPKKEKKSKTKKGKKGAEKKEGGR
jgi:hypothetical protein